MRFTMPMIPSGHAQAEAGAMPPADLVAEILPQDVQQAAGTLRLGTQ